MSNFSRFRGIAAGTGFLLGSLGVAAAQEQPELRFEGVRGGRVDAQPVAVEEVAVEPESVLRPTVELTRESRNFLSQRTEDAAVLSRQSTSSFQGGLLPLIDYLNQLAIVEYVDVRAADLTGPGERIAVYRRQVELLEDAWSRLVAFNQPGSAGWRSDTVLAELALNEARLKLAEASGDTGSIAMLRSQSETLARAHYQAREFDYQLGLASLPMMAYAAKLSADAALAGEHDPRSVAALNRDKQRYLQLVLSQTEAWSSVGAGLGRVDRLGAARLDRDLAALDAALAAESPTISPENVSRASREFSQLFDRQLEFYRHGTASLAEVVRVRCRTRNPLYDLTRTWVAWREVHRSVALNAEDALDEADVSRRGDALRDLQLVADNMSDLRGRHAGDVTFARLAGRLDELDELYTEVDPRVEYLP